MRLVYKGQITPGKQERNKIRPQQACEATDILTSLESVVTAACQIVTPEHDFKWI